MDNISGKTLGTWEGLMPFGLSDSKIQAKQKIGSYDTKKEALSAARENKGAEAVIRGKDGKYNLYGINDNSSYDFNRDNIEQCDGYTVSNVTTKGAQVKNVVAFVTEDDYEVRSPSEHRNRLSGNHYNFSSKNKISAFAGKSKKDMQKVFDANTTKGITRANPPENVKKALEPSLKILELYDSKAADWLRGLDEDDYALAGKTIKALNGESEIYAAWTAVIREGMKLHVSDMVLGDNFWELSDVDKASALYHEYVHAVDDPVIRQFHKTYGAIENAITGEYGDKAEDKAYSAQWKMLDKLGVKSGSMYYEVKSYVEDRKLAPFDK